MDENDFAVLTSYAPIIFMVVLFYLLLYRPQKKQQKKQQDMLSRLQKGTKVVTRGGILGVVDEVKENTVMLEVAKGVSIEIAKSMIGTDYENKEELEQEQQKAAEAYKASQAKDK
ncbi:MAG: preprotein translocase subunit YajC [Anaerovibrio sp.]|uniref:preprotein translocase subunit YajC n=1 Tax=Anaerovibrio sp. TaxID=1872532 RepID=UPI0025F10883|nr:preprotein translocase subunit YajC [Anaerovibrio sp.]MCR5175584.1 preprotein translocase subunit YajC [Anaerovibrio sp.]